MAVKKGQFAKVTMDVNGTPVDIMKLREWTVSIESDKLDSTAANQKWKTHEISFIGWEGEATCIDADLFWLSYLETKVTIDFYDAATDVDPTLRGTASLNVERTVSYDALIEQSISFSGDGELLDGTGLGGGVV